jgi:hypothetical protein
MDRKKHIPEIGSIRKDMATSFQHKVIENFKKELGKADDITALSDLAIQMKDLAYDKTWREATWKDDTGSWRESWSEDNSLVSRPGLLENPALFADRLRETIDQLAQSPTTKG